LPWVDDAWRNLRVLTKRLEDGGMEMERNGRKWMEMDGNIGGRNSKELNITKSDNVQHTQTPVYQHQLRRVKNPCMHGRPARGRVDSLIPYHLGIQIPMLHSFNKNITENSV